MAVSKKLHRVQLFSRRPRQPAAATTRQRFSYKPGERAIRTLPRCKMGTKSVGSARVAPRRDPDPTTKQTAWPYPRGLLFARFFCGPPSGREGRSASRWRRAACRRLATAWEDPWRKTKQDARAHVQQIILLFQNRDETREQITAYFSFCGTEKSTNSKKYIYTYI